MPFWVVWSGSTTSPFWEYTMDVSILCKSNGKSFLRQKANIMGFFFYGVRNVASQRNCFGQFFYGFYALGDFTTIWFSCTYVLYCVYSRVTAIPFSLRYIHSFIVTAANQGSFARFHVHLRAVSTIFPFLCCFTLGRFAHFHVRHFGSLSQSTPSCCFIQQ